MPNKRLLLIRATATLMLSGFRPAGTGADPEPRSTLPTPKHRFVVVAHRGLHNQLPENSLASFDAAARAGVDYVEMDLRTTKDSVLVILHDASLDRTTDGSGPLAERTFAELQKLKLKNNPAAVPASVPTFDEVLALCRDRIYIYLDFKSASVSQTMTLIRKHKMESQVIVYINSPVHYSEWRRLEPEMPLMLSLPDTVRSAASLKLFLTQYPAAVLDGDYTGYSKEILAEAGAEQVSAWPDIQGKEEARHWQNAIDTGFSGLQTDHPEALIAWLRKRGLR